MSKYSEEELCEMAEVVMSYRGKPIYSQFVQTMSFYTGLPVYAVVKRVEEYLNEEK